MEAYTQSKRSGTSLFKYLVCDKGDISNNRKNELLNK